MTVFKGIKINNINHFYNKNQSIKNFSLTVNSGEIVCILGPSGCGKTTLLRLISGFEDPSSGQIVIGNKVVFGKEYIPTEKRGVGMLFQDIALFPHLTVKDNINFSIKKHKNNKDLVINLLRKVGLERLMNRYPDTISGGEQQRVALARALARKPDLMLLDEPFASLDSWSKYDIGSDIISILKSTDTATLMVTHDPQEAMRFSDRILVMFNGSIIDEGNPYDLYKKSQNSFTARLLGPLSSFSIITKNKKIKGGLSVFLLDDILLDGKYEVLIRPDAFSIPLGSDGFSVEVLNFKSLGSITEVEIGLGKENNVLKILIYTNILKDLIKKKKLLFNKDWAFVFPKN